MKKERDEKKERETRLLKRQQLKTLSQSLVARREMGEYMGNEDDTVNGLLRFYYTAYMGNARCIESRAGTHRGTEKTRSGRGCERGLFSVVLPLCGKSST